MRRRPLRLLHRVRRHQGQGVSNLHSLFLPCCVSELSYTGATLWRLFKNWKKKKISLEKSWIAHVHVLEMKSNVQKLVGLFFQSWVYLHKKRVRAVPPSGGADSSFWALKPRKMSLLFVLRGRRWKVSIFFVLSIQISNCINRRH